MLKLYKKIKDDIKSKKNKYIGTKYYNYKPKQKITEINTYQDDEIHTFSVNENCFLYTNYFKMLVKQKLNYLLAKEPEIKLDKYITTVTKVTDMLEEGVLNASLECVTWLHFYVENNKLDWIFVKDKEIMPIYDKYNKKIEKIIRYYPLKSDDKKEKYQVETWTKNGVKIEIIDKDKIIDSEINSHYEETTEYNGVVENMEQKNMPFLPFIPLFNNRDKTSDLDGIQELIDMYNMINSGFVDNINLFQEAITKLKGFAVDTEELEIIQSNMKKYKMVSVPNESGDVEYMAVEIPVEARKTILDILKENIFKIGQGLDPDKLAGESNITNTVIKSRYSALDMKSNGSEKQLKLFYEEFVECLNLFYKTNQPKDLTTNKSMIFNEGEQIDNCLKSLNMLPLDEILPHHPFVKGDVKKLLNKLKQEKEEAFKEQLKQQKLLNDSINNTEDFN